MEAESCEFCIQIPTSPVRRQSYIKLSHVRWSGIGVVSEWNEGINFVFSKLYLE